MTTSGHPTSPSPRSRPAPRSRPRLTRNVARGVHRLEHAHVNLYLIDDGAAGVTVVDAAFPATWLPLRLALEAIGRHPRDVRALVLTHVHFDHVGVAARLRQERVPADVRQPSHVPAADPQPATVQATGPARRDLAATSPAHLSGWQSRAGASCGTPRRWGGRRTRTRR